MHGLLFLKTAPVALVSTWREQRHLSTQLKFTMGKSYESANERGIGTINVQLRLICGFQKANSEHTHRFRRSGRNEFLERSDGQGLFDDEDALRQVRWDILPERKQNVGNMSANTLAKAGRPSIRLSSSHCSWNVKLVSLSDDSGKA